MLYLDRYKNELMNIDISDFNEFGQSLIHLIRKHIDEFTKFKILSPLSGKITLEKTYPPPYDFTYVESPAPIPHPEKGIMWAGLFYIYLEDVKDETQNRIIAYPILYFPQTDGLVFTSISLCFLNGRTGLTSLVGHPGDIKDPKEARDEICHSYWLFTELLKCNNIYVKTNHPDVALNKKRIRNGKEPLSIYKTLHIRPSKQQIIRHIEMHGEGTPKRQHLRRGHIRNLPSGVKTWVSSCMVGQVKNGKVIKDYQL